MTIDTPSRIAFLKKIHLFYGLDDKALADIAEEMDEVNVQKGEVVFKQDGPADGFYMIYGGNVRITRRQDGKDHQVALLVKNDYFGELALVSNRRRSATVTALEDTSLLFLSRADFKKLFKNHPEIKYDLEVAVKSRQLARRFQLKWLQQDEVVYFLARKHRLVLYQKLVIPAIALLVPLGLLYAWFAFVRTFIVIFAGGAALLAVAAWIVWQVIDWGNDYYIVTNQRAVWLEKVIFLYDSRQEAPLANILAVDVDTSQLGRILDYGSVVMKTYVGKITFNSVSHPEQAARMIEEYWERTKAHSAGVAKEAMKDAIRKRLGLPIPVQAKADVKPPAPPPPRRGVLSLLSFLSVKIRYEQGESVFYRKHWFVLIKQALIPLASVMGILLVFILRLYRLAISPTEAWMQVVDGVVQMDTYILTLPLALVPFLLWIVYVTLDWSNDKFEVTPDQIIDIDRKPFGNESRNASQLENILSTFYERKGVWGYLLNFGTVYITVGGAKLAFEDVMDPAAVQNDIDRRRTVRKNQQEEAKVAAERERMAEWLVTYHKSAEEFRSEEEKKRNQQNGAA